MFDHSPESSALFLRNIPSVSRIERFDVTEDELTDPRFRASTKIIVGCLATIAAGTYLLFAPVRIEIKPASLIDIPAGMVLGGAIGIRRLHDKEDALAAAEQQRQVHEEPSETMPVIPPLIPPSFIPH